ncbi:MAG TPA: hypothetical protein VI729_03440 [Anaerolineales bacterium]|nr:hypothetical protein [Anaerolineales bacterium]
MNASQAAHPVWPEWVYPYSAGVMGGLIGGMGVALVGAGYGLISGVGVWLPVNLVAAAVLRQLQLQSLGEIASFNPLALGTGLILHVGTSIALGAMFSFLLPALPGRPLFWGPVIGPLLWVGASVAALPVINPVMSANLEIVSFAIANVLYGLLLGWWIDRTPMVRVSH